MPDRLLDLLLVYGPGFAVCAIAWLALRIYENVRDLLRRANQQVDDALTIPAAADNQPGTDAELLNTITAAWNADTRKEN
ncbi:hypothetical protein [Streptomyces albogriseolus]|uniref:hypothetical protein n=1 Tax=Streptomyces albogriseolus TaxID=1887 RepID=UPI0036B39192